MSLTSHGTKDKFAVAASAVAMSLSKEGGRVAKAGNAELIVDESWGGMRNKEGKRPNTRVSQSS